MNTDLLLDDFAFRSFRDEGDVDYIAARMAHRARLVTPFLWSSQQTIEKYLNGAYSAAKFVVQGAGDE
jgi:hypothetical protein